MRLKAADVLPDAASVGSGPTIAVVVSLNLPAATESVAALMRQLTTTALATIVDVGAVPSLVDLTARQLVATDDVVAADGIVVLGGGDMDAALYGESRPVPNEYGVDRRADDYSIQVVRAALAEGVPLLGVCRGAQVLNVALGGTLISDIADFKLHRGPTHDSLFINETIRFEPTSQVADLFGRDRLVVRTGHHQAIGTVGTGLRVVGRAGDGLTEAVEHTERWAIGVQWHPEESHASVDDRRLLFGGLVRAADERRSRYDHH